jgi:hypothetical protein
MQIDVEDAFHVIRFVHGDDLHEGIDIVEGLLISV